MFKATKLPSDWLINVFNDFKVSVNGNIIISVFNHKIKETNEMNLVYSTTQKL